MNHPLEWQSLKGCHSLFLVIFSFPGAAWECRLDRVAVRIGMRRIQQET